MLRAVFVVVWVGGNTGGSASQGSSPLRSSADGAKPQTTSPPPHMRHKAPSVSNLLNLPASLVNFEKNAKGDEGDANKVCISKAKSHYVCVEPKRRQKDCWAFHNMQARGHGSGVHIGVRCGCYKS